MSSLYVLVDIEGSPQPHSPQHLLKDFMVAEPSLADSLAHKDFTSLPGMSTLQAHADIGRSPHIFENLFLRLVLTCWDVGRGKMHSCLPQFSKN